MLDNHQDIENLFRIIRNSIKRDFKYFYDVPDTQDYLLTPNLYQLKQNYNEFVKTGKYPYKVVFCDLLPIPKVDINETHEFTEYDYNYYLYYDLKKDWHTKLKTKFEYKDEVSLMTYCIKYIENSRIKRIIAPVNEPVMSNNIKYDVFDTFNTFVNALPNPIKSDKGDEYERSTDKNIDGCTANIKYLEAYKTKIRSNPTLSEKYNDADKLIAGFNKVIIDIENNTKNYNDELDKYTKYLALVKEEKDKYYVENTILYSALCIYFKEQKFATGGCKERIIQNFTHKATTTTTPSAKTASPTTGSPKKGPPPANTGVPTANTKTAATKSVEHVELAVIVQEQPTGYLLTKLVYIDIPQSETSEETEKIEIKLRKQKEDKEFEEGLKNRTKTTKDDEAMFSGDESNYSIYEYSGTSNIFNRKENELPFKVVIKLGKTEEDPFKQRKTPGAFMFFRYNMYMLQKIINNKEFKKIDEFNKYKILYVTDVTDFTKSKPLGVMVSGNLINCLIDNSATMKFAQKIIVDDQYDSINVSMVNEMRNKRIRIINTFCSEKYRIMDNDQMDKLNQQIYLHSLGTHDTFDNICNLIINYKRDKSINNLNNGFDAIFIRDPVKSFIIKELSVTHKDIYTDIDDQYFINVYLEKNFKLNVLTFSNFFFKKDQKSLDYFVKDINTFKSINFEKYNRLTNVLEERSNAETIPITIMNSFYTNIKKPFDKAYNETIQNVNILLVKQPSNKDTEEDNLDTKIEQLSTTYYGKFTVLFNEDTRKLIKKLCMETIIYNFELFLSSDSIIKEAGDSIQSGVTWILNLVREEKIQYPKYLELRELVLLFQCIIPKNIIKQELISVLKDRNVYNEDSNKDEIKVINEQQFYGTEKGGMEVVDDDVQDVDNLRIELAKLKKKRLDAAEKPRKKKKSKEEEE